VAEAEAEAEAAAEHAATELTDLQKKASCYDDGVRGDAGARGRARMTQSDDPLRQGMIARSLLDESERRQGQYEEALALRAG